MNDYTTERRSAVLDRTRTLRGTEVRVAGTPAEPRLIGHAAVFDSLSVPLGGSVGFRETIKKGFFAPALQRGDDVKLLINHQGLPLARTKSGTLSLREDAIGLWFEARLDAADPDVTSLLPKIRRGDVSSCSFAFTVAPRGDSWEETPDGPIRTLVTIDRLMDVSIVCSPAYEETDVQARNRTWPRATYPAPPMYRFPSALDTIREQRRVTDGGLPSGAVRGRDGYLRCPE